MEFIIWKLFRPIAAAAVSGCLAAIGREENFLKKFFLKGDRGKRELGMPSRRRPEAAPDARACGRLCSMDAKGR